MNKRADSEMELALTLAKRSTCNVQVGAVFYDKFGVFAWGWNSSGNGFGECAERHGIYRANRDRLEDSTVVVGAVRKNKQIISRPCEMCLLSLRACGVAYAVYMDKDRKIVRERL